MTAHLSFVLTRLLFLSSLVFSVSASQPKPSCKNPKVRKEWRQLSTNEQKGWIDAVNCLGSLPHDPKFQPMVAPNISQIPPVTNQSSFYDDIVYAHMDLNPLIHYTGFFLPWHRAYVKFFEDSLVEKCGYNGTTPYWDWSIDAHDIYNAGIWSNDSSSGLGWWGDANNDLQINTGGFKDQIRVYPSSHHIRRNFSLYPFRNPIFGAAAEGLTDYKPNDTMTAENVEYMVGGFDGDFVGFHSYFEGINGPHGSAHLILAGDMGGLCPGTTGPPDCIFGPKWTPNDPVFFLHHGMVDKLWHDWQKRLPMNKYSFGGGTVSVFGTADWGLYPTGEQPYANLSTIIPGDGLWENITIWDMMDTQAGPLCYTYT